MIAGIVLAAGASTRMGAPKALLTDKDGRIFVARIVRTLAAAGVGNVVVVTGHLHDRIIEACSRDGCTDLARFVVNPAPELGQLSSIVVGLDAVIQPSTEALLVTLVDVPMVRIETMRAVIDAWTASRASIVRPAVGDRHGHPVIFARALFDELRRAPLDVGAKAVVRAHAAEIQNVPVEDIGCVTDVDTPEDYRLLLNA